MLVVGRVWISFSTIHFIFNFFFFIYKFTGYLPKTSMDIRWNDVPYLRSNDHNVTVNNAAQPNQQVAQGHVIFEPANCSLVVVVAIKQDRILKVTLYKKNTHTHTSFSWFCKLGYLSSYNLKNLLTSMSYRISKSIALDCSSLGTVFLGILPYGCPIIAYREN